MFKNIYSIFIYEFCISADIIFVTEDIPHEIFKRQGDNLEMTVDIFLSDALIGTTVTVNTLDDRIIRIPITSIITYVFCPLFLLLN